MSKLSCGLQFILGLLLVFQPCLRADDHIVSSADLHKELAASAQARKENLEKVQTFFASPAVRKALASARMDGGKVQRAVPSLSDDELARLAQQTDRVQQDFVAGALSNQDLTYIVIALAAAVLVLIIVAA
ncbi:MAG: hypothetical protein HY508_07650 [Acidobacteria bacterium]|nr:hypothetical protein [Acidobacteriota bacterium]